MNLKSKITTSLIIFTTFGLSFFNCKKYPDDEGINLTKARKRIYGEWKLKRIMLDGNDITDFMNSQVQNRNYTNFVLHVMGDYTSRGMKDSYCTMIMMNSSGDRFQSLGCSLFDKDEPFLISFGSPPSTLIDNYSLGDSLIASNLFGRYKILRLQKHNFNIKSLTNNIEYEFEK